MEATCPGWRVVENFWLAGMVEEEMWCNEMSWERRREGSAQ